MANINSLNSYNAGWLFNTQQKNQKQDSISKLWSSYGNFQSNAASALSGLSEINANVKSVLASYEEAKATFNTELDETLGDLGKSAAAVKAYDFSGIEKDGAITQTTQTDADGNVTTTTKYSEKLQAALDTVKDLVNDYNSAVKFFGEHKDVSKRIENVATAFADTTYRAASYVSIGLTTNSDGSISINEDKLVNAILNDPGKVATILGKDGLAGKAESHISFADSQRDKLFPTAEKMLGDQLDTAAIYTGSAYRNISALNNMGNLINMMF